MTNLQQAYNKSSITEAQIWLQLINVLLVQLSKDKPIQFARIHLQSIQYFSELFQGFSFVCQETFRLSEYNQKLQKSDFDSSVLKIISIILMVPIFVYSNKNCGKQNILVVEHLNKKRNRNGWRKEYIYRSGSYKNKRKQHKTIGTISLPNKVQVNDATKYQ